MDQWAFGPLGESLVWASIKVLCRLVSVLPQLLTNWVETIFSLQNVSGVGGVEY